MGELPPSPPNLSLSKNFIRVGKFSAKKCKFGAENPSSWGKFRDKTEILSTAPILPLWEIFQLSVGKLHLLATPPPTFLSDDAAGGQMSESLVTTLHRCDNTPSHAGVVHPPIQFSLQANTVQLTANAHTACQPTTVTLTGSVRRQTNPTTVCPSGGKLKYPVLQ